MYILLIVLMIDLVRFRPRRGYEHKHEKERQNKKRKRPMTCELFI